LTDGMQQRYCAVLCIWSWLSVAWKQTFCCWAEERTEGKQSSEERTEGNGRAADPWWNESFQWQCVSHVTVSCCLHDLIWYDLYRWSILPNTVLITLSTR
jgi:hypothetical protein